MAHRIEAPDVATQVDATLLRIPTLMAELAASIIRVPLVAAQLGTTLIAIPFVAAQVATSLLGNLAERLDGLLEETAGTRQPQRTAPTNPVHPHRYMEPLETRKPQAPAEQYRRDPANGQVRSSA